MIRKMATALDTVQCAQIAKRWIQQSETFEGIDVDDSMLDRMGAAIITRDDHCGFMLCDDDKIKAFICGKTVPLWFSRRHYVEDIIMCKLPGETVTHDEIDELVAAFAEWAWSTNPVYVMFGDTLGIAPRAVEQIYIRAGAEVAGVLYKLER